MSDRDVHEEMREKNRRARIAAREETARVRAEAVGKEPFTHEAFLGELACTGEATDYWSTEALEDIETSYYLHHPRFKTLREMALTVAGLGPLPEDPPGETDPRVETRPPVERPSPSFADCVMCEGNAYPTGVRAVSDGRPMLEVKCEQCSFTSLSWRRAWVDEGYLPAGGDLEEWARGKG